MAHLNSQTQSNTNLYLLEKENHVIYPPSDFSLQCPLYLVLYHFCLNENGFIEYSCAMKPSSRLTKTKDASLLA